MKKYITSLLIITGLLFSQNVMAVNLYVVRHGETDYNKNRIVQGQENPSLNEKGRQDADSASSKLESITFSNIYSSDLIRAVQTAEIISNKIAIKNSKINQDSNIREYHFGIHQGKIKTQEFVDDFLLARNGIESESSLQKRVFLFLDKIEKQHEPTDNIIVVGHAGVMNLLLKSSMGGQDGFVGNGSILLFRLDQGELYFDSVIHGKISPASKKLK